MKNIFLIGCCFFLCLLHIPFAQATSELTFKPAHDSLGPSLDLSLGAFLKALSEKNTDEFLIAKTDLNEDSALEYILKSKECAVQKKECAYLILAQEKNDKLSLLLSVKAYHLMIGNEKTYGIKNILAFKNPANAYDFSIYMWSPSKKMYILKDEEKGN